MCVYNSSKRRDLTNICDDGCFASNKFVLMTFDYICHTIEISPILALSQCCSALKTAGHCPQLVRGPSAPRLPGKKGPVRSSPGLDGQSEEETAGAESTDCS